MEEQIWNLLKEHGSPLLVPKGTAITGIAAKYSADMLFFLSDGIAALTSITKSGEEKVYLYFHAPRLIGFNRHFNRAKERAIAEPEFFNMAKTDCTLYQISFPAFMKLLQDSPELNTLFIKTIANNCTEALSHFHFSQEESAIVRLCHLLLEVSQPYKNKMVVPKFYSYAELARYLGCHPITVSRIMPRLKEAGYIRKEAMGIVIENPDGLVHIIESESKFKY